MVSLNLQKGSAWVVGGSVAGMLAAGALAKHFDRVFVVDRDLAVGGSDPRKGVPQGRHVHALLPRGVAAAETLFPGIHEEIIEGGANHGDLCGDAQWCPGGHKLMRSESQMRVLAGSRPFIEYFITQRALALPNVELIPNTIVTGFETDNGKISGIQLRDRSGENRTEVAKVIVDAAGRGSRLPKWLEERGLNAPPEESIEVKIGYASIRFRLSTAKNVDLKALIIGASPDVPRGGIAQAVEHDVLQVSMAAYSETPPTDLEEFKEYAKTLAIPDIHRWMEGAEPIDDQIKTYGVPRAYRRKFDKVRGLPEGLLAIGDSICAFNPVYAQGMTVAAVEAQLMDECLVGGLKGITKRYFKSIRSVTDVTWQMGSTSDLSMPIIEGDLSLPTRMIGKWINRVQYAGTRDPYVAAKFIRVAALLDPPTSLLSPGFIWRVLRGPQDKDIKPEPISCPFPQAQSS